MWRIRESRPDETEAVIALLDAALLAFDREAIRGSSGEREMYVAEEDTRIRGAIVLKASHIVAIAVQPRHRHRGVGRSLVANALDHHGSVTADWDPRVHGFFDALGFVWERTDDGRYRGRLHGPLE